jgi:hypothetical protein
VSYRSEDGVHNALREDLTGLQSLASSDSRTLSSSRAKTISKQAGMLETIAEGTRTSGGYNIDTSTEEGKAVGEVLNDVDALNKTNNYGWRQNAETALKAYASGGIKIPGTKIGIGGSVDGSVSAGNHSDQVNGEGSTINRENNSNKSYSNVSKALNNDAWTKEHGVTEDMSKGVHEAYEESQRAEQQLAHRHEKIDTYNKAIDHTKTHGATISKEMYQEVLETHAKKSKKSMEAARTDLENRTPEVIGVFNQLTRREADQVLNQIHAGKARLSPEAAKEQLDESSKEYDKKIDPNIGGEVNKVAAAKGFNPQNIKTFIAEKGETNKETFNELHNKNENKYNETKAANESKEKVMKATIDQNEKDRLGNGIVAKAMSDATYSHILGKNLIAPVGRPEDKINRTELNFNYATPEEIEELKYDPNISVKPYTGGASNRSDGQKVSQDIVKGKNDS